VAVAGVVVAVCESCNNFLPHDVCCKMPAIIIITIIKPIGLAGGFDLGLSFLKSFFSAIVVCKLLDKHSSISIYYIYFWDFLRDFLRLPRKGEHIFQSTSNI